MLLTNTGSTAEKIITTKDKNEEIEIDPDIISLSDDISSGKTKEILIPIHPDETTKSLYDSETVFIFFIQTLVPLLLAGFGLVGTGAYLDHVATNKFFTTIPEAFTLTTSLLDLKGNLEMNFASRLSTLAHTRAFVKPGVFRKVVIANFGLTQTHTVTVSLTIAILCLLVDFTGSPRNMLILVSTAVATASFSSVFIDSFLITIILIAKYFNFNPDNISTPIAASVGDIATLLIFAFIGGFQVIHCSLDSCIISLILIFIFISLLPLFVQLARSHSQIKKDLCYGWFMLIFSALLSGGGGYILKITHKLYDGYALLQPLVVGLVGNRSSIQSSRISSTLHIRQDLQMGEYPNGSLINTLNPLYGFGTLHSKVAIVLIISSIPMNFLFTILALTISEKTFLINWTFLIPYMIASIFLLSIFMYLSSVVVHLMWRVGLDPDYNAIPLLTSLVDLFGSLLLFFVFYILNVGSSTEKVSANSTISPLIKNVTKTIIIITNTTIQSV